MKNWKYDLFMFKKDLTLDQLAISGIVEKHLQIFESLSEKELFESLKLNLKPYDYDTDIKKLFESMEEELVERPLLYNLKDLYKKVERKNYGELYREPLNKILDIIIKDDDESRMNSILNELVMYDWIPEIKKFVVDLTSDPIQKQNLTNNAKSSKVFTLVEQVDGGHIAYISDRWFLLTENEVNLCTLPEVIKDEKKLRTLKILESAMNLADIENDKINFLVDEHLKISFGIVDGKIFINDEKADDQTTLEDLFNSPIIPFMKKNIYESVKRIHENLDKIIELDVTCKTTSLSKPLMELYAFNYKDKMYIYNVDKRIGSTFFEYNSVNELINDVQRELGYDLSHFYENKLSKEMKQYKRLEDKEKEIELKIQDVNESIEELQENQAIMNETAELKTAFDNLLIYRQNLTNSLNKLKDEKSQSKKRY